MTYNDTLTTPRSLRPRHVTRSLSGCRKIRGTSVAVHPTRDHGYSIISWRIKLSYYIGICGITINTLWFCDLSAHSTYNRVRGNVSIKSLLRKSLNPLNGRINMYDMLTKRFRIGSWEAPARPSSNRRILL